MTTPPPRPMTRAEIETRLEAILDEQNALERELYEDDPETAQDHRARLAFLDQERRVLEGLISGLAQSERIARSS